MKSASVTVNWGPPSDTVVALQSLASMTRPPDLIICIDNGSPAADVSQLRAGMPKDTVFIALDDNIGLAAAHNVGMDYALSQDVDWTLLLNNDAIATAQCLDRCIAEATADPRIAIVGPAVTFTDEPHLLWFAGGNVSERFACPRSRVAYASPRLPRRRAQTSVIYPAAAHCCRRRHSDRLARSGLTTSCTTRKPSGASGPQLGGGGSVILARFCVRTPSAPVEARAAAWGSPKTRPITWRAILCGSLWKRPGRFSDSRG